MRQFPPTTSLVGSMFRKAAGAIGAFLRSSWEGPVRKSSGRPLYARSRTEMAGEAQPWRASRG
jgi:hypothetical protein